MFLYPAGLVRCYPRTCYEIQQSGGGEGIHEIDPDQDGLEPMAVFCNMSSSPVTAVLHHNQENWMHVDGYENKGSWNGVVCIYIYIYIYININININIYIYIYICLYLVVLGTYCKTTLYLLYVEYQQYTVHHFCH